MAKPNGRAPRQRVGATVRTLREQQAISLDEQRRRTLADASRAMAEFHRVFATQLSVDSLAVIFVADRLGLEIAIPANNKGFDACDPRTGERYEVKYRADGVPQVDLNSFEFDRLVLVNLGPDYRPSGLWQITRPQAERVFAPREYRGISKFQCSQTRFKDEARRLG
ncbi:MAG TPA: hypothetical protein VGW38_12920 [Chloroflexota bacterium]|nr:hypothetical protein [Chloroflexota bacterium]